MKLKRTFISIVALMLAVCLMPTALAATWYLEDGDITVIADENGQSVKQGNNDAVADDDVVITQRDSEKATDNTITVSTSDDATANITIENVNISSDGDAIDVGSSSANITLEGDNKLNSEHGSGIHVSGGDVTITGSGSLEAGSKIDSNNNAAIGSHENEDMSGDITIGGNAKITAVSRDDGAGIGSGDKGEMSGDITIGDNAQVTAWSETGGAGIGSGRENDMSGNITIGGSAQVTAGSNSETAGIGSGNNGVFTSTGRVVIRDSAKVTAIGENEGAGIGTGEDELMAGLIIIQDNAQVTSIAGDRAAAIGSDNQNEMTGTIIIIGNARVTTGILDYDYDNYDDSVYFDYNTKEIKYTLDENAIGYIGDSKYSNHESDNGHYIIGPDVTINGISGSDIEALKDYINMRLSGENHDGEPENLTKLDVRSENGEFTVTAEGEGTVEKILYGGSETVPTAPGKYPVTCVVRIGEETIEFRIGTYVVPEPEPQPEPVAYHERIQLYRVADKNGRSIAYKAVQQGGVLTVTTDEKEAQLIIERGGLFALNRQGITKIVFVTASKRSVISVSAAMEKGSGEFVLLHSSRKVKLTIAGAAVDADGILIKE